MDKILLIIMFAVVIWGVIPTRHTISSRSCDFSFAVNDTVCTSWTTEYYYSPGWLVKALEGK